MRKGILIVSILGMGCFSPAVLAGECESDSFKDFLDTGSEVQIRESLKGYLTKKLLLDSSQSLESEVRIEFVRDVLSTVFDMSNLLPSIVADPEFKDAIAGDPKSKDGPISISQFLMFISIADRRQRVQEAYKMIGSITNKKARSKMARQFYRHASEQHAFRIWYLEDTGNLAHMRNKLIESSLASKIELNDTLRQALQLQMKLEALNSDRGDAEHVLDRLMKQKETLRTELHKQIDALRKRTYRMVAQSPYEKFMYLTREVETFGVLKKIFWDFVKKDTNFIVRWCFASFLYVSLQHKRWLNFGFFKKYIFYPIVTVFLAFAVKEGLEQLGFSGDLLISLVKKVVGIK